MNIRFFAPSLLAALAASVSAADRTWDGGDATANMTAAANWNGNTVINPAVDELLFPQGLAVADRTVNNNYAANTLFHRMQFNDSYTLNGTIMELDDALLCFHDAGTTVTVNAGFSLQSLASFSTASGNLVFGAGSQIYLNGNTVNCYAGNPEGNITVGGLLAGSGQLNIFNEGTVRFSGAKTFTAPVGIKAGGTLIVDNAGSLGAGAGHTTITDGTLVLDSAGALNVPERILMNNLDPLASRVLSQGGGHTLSGPIEFSGDHFKRFDVQGTSLTLSGAISGPVSFGSMRKTGPGRLILSGAASNTFGIQIFSAYQGETLLNKSGGATAISSPFVLIGNNAAPANSAIVRLGAAHQIADGTVVNLSRDGWLDLNGHAETISQLQFVGDGQVTTGGAALRINGDVDAFSATQSGGTATITGDLVLGTAISEWNTYTGTMKLGLTVNGNLSAAVPGAEIYKYGDGDLTLRGNHTVPRLKVEGGFNIMSGDSPGTDVDAGGAWFLLEGTVKDLTVSAETLALTGQQPNVAVDCEALNFSTGAMLSVSFGPYTPVPGETHDVIRAGGEVNLSGGVLQLYQYGGQNPTLAPGDEIVIVEKAGSVTKVTGEFQGMPEGTIVTSTAGDKFVISYQGGDGNDVTVTYIIAPTGVTRLWDGGGADNNWMTANNWNPNGVPQPGDALVFPTTANRKNNVNNFPAGTTFQSLTIHGTGYGLGGNGIVVNEKIEFTSANGDHFLSLPVTLALDVTLSLTGNSFIQSTAFIDLNGHRLTLHNAGGGDGDLYISGNITGAGQVRKTGHGSVTYFEQPNSYTGPTFVIEGTLAVKAGATLGAAGPGNGSNVQPGAMLLLRNNEGDVVIADSITLQGGTIADSGGTFAAVCSSTVWCYDGTPVIEAIGDQLTLSGPVHGSANLFKTGPGTLTLSGNAPNNINELQIARGRMVLAKMNTHACLEGVRVGTDGQAATLTLATSNQLPDSSFVQLEHPLGLMECGTQQERIALLKLNGGSVTGTAPGLLTTDTVETIAQTAASVISVPLSAPPGLHGVLQIADGSAATDLRVQSIVYGQSFTKRGPGRADFTVSIPPAGLDHLDITEGSVLVFANCQHTNIGLNGGLLGGQGTVGQILSGTGGVISPGASPGALGGGTSVWNGSTVFRAELNGLSPGAEYDQYFANGTLNLGGAALTLAAGFDPAPGAEFMIIRNVSGAPVTGTFAGIPQNGYVSAPGAKVFQINYTGGDGDDVMLTRVEVEAPEIVSHSMAPGTEENEGSYETSLTVHGTPGLTYHLESSTDLQTWTFQQAAKADLLTGDMQFEFFNKETDPRLFLRVRLP